MNKIPDDPPPYGFQQPQPPPEQFHPQQPPPEPQQFHPQQPPPQPATVVINHAGPMPVGPNSQHMTCPSCHHVISSRIESETTTKTHILAILLCAICCWPCVFVPYCLDMCKNINHYCPKCNSFLGSYIA